MEDTNIQLQEFIPADGLINYADFLRRIHTG